MTEAAVVTRSYTAVFPRSKDAQAFFERVQTPGEGWSVQDLKRKGNSKTVTWTASPAEPGQYLMDMAETVGYYGSSFGEPPTGYGRFTATLNGHPCPASM